MSSRDTSPTTVPGATGLLHVGAWAAFGSVGLIVVQVVVFAIWPPVHTVAEVFELMGSNPVLGLVSLDLLYVINNVLVWLFYLGLGAALWQTSRTSAALIVGLGMLQMAAYFASNPAVEMLALAHGHAAAAPPAQAMFEAAGEALLVSWKGTAFLTYYFLGAAVLLILFGAMRRPDAFSRATAWWALAAGILMLVPSTFGTVGMVFALASLVPWSVLCMLAGRRLLGVLPGDVDRAATALAVV